MPSTSRPALYRRGVFLTLSALNLLSCEPAVEAADLVLTGGKVVTVDEAHPEAEAIAVRGDRIVAVGSSAEIDAYVGASTTVIDLEGRLATPGLIEGHGHFLGLGQAKMILDLTTATTWQDIVDMVAEAAEEALPGEWITGRGWHQEKWSVVPTPSVDGVPVHTSLSAVSPNNPVNLTHASGHASFANSKAMEVSGITRSTPDPEGGTIVKDARGNPSGLLRETAQRIVGAAISLSQEGLSEAERESIFRRQVELAGEEALSKGITNFHDAGTSFADIDRLKVMAEESRLPIRLYVMVRRESNEVMAEKLPQYRMIGVGNNFLTVRSIKRQIDGALGSHGAWLLEPYLDLPSSVGLTLESPDDIRRTAEIAVEHGFQVNTHAIGDMANREVLDIYQETFEAAGNPENLRWRIEHAQHLDPNDLKRFVELGVIAAVQGVHATSDGPWIPRRLGDERTESGAYLWRSMINMGITVMNGTDVPVEDIDPIANFYSSVSRMMNTGERFYPAQGMTRDEALRSYTINAAFGAFQEEDLGSITVGKLADIVILSDDIMTIPEDQIPLTRVDVTIVGGEVRFRRN